MGGNASSSSQIANDTDDVLEVKVEYNGNSSVHLVPAHNHATVLTPAFTDTIYFPGCVIVELHVPSAVAAGQWHWLKRTVIPGSNVLIRKREIGYVIYQSKQGEIWKIDEGNAINKSLGF